MRVKENGHMSNQKIQTCLILFNSRKLNKYALKERTLRILFAPRLNYNIIRQ